MSDMQPPSRTREARVKLFLRDGAMVEGVLHMDSDRFERRVSDLLNVSPPNFVSLTDAVYERAGERENAETVLVNTSDIVMVHTSAGEARPWSGPDRAMPGTAF